MDLDRLLVLCPLFFVFRLVWSEAGHDNSTHVLKYFGNQISLVMPHLTQLKP